MIKLSTHCNKPTVKWFDKYRKNKNVFAINNYKLIVINRKYKDLGASPNKEGQFLFNNKFNL